MDSTQITTAQTPQDILGILKLQQQNLRSNLDSTEAASQGFVTVNHDFELLKAMNQKHPHIIAKSGDDVIAYALVMLPEFSAQIPILAPMFERIETLQHNNNPIQPGQYFIMGQICVSKPHRSKGVVAALYKKMVQRMSQDFQYIITEIAATNPRSIQAHKKTGFETLDIYESDGIQWHIVILELNP